MKPYWEIQHDWWREDFGFWAGEREELVGLLRKHPDDSMGDNLRLLIKTIDSVIKKLKKGYKKIYGTNLR